MDLFQPQTFNLPEGEAGEALKLADLLRKVDVGGRALPMGKAGTMVQGRLGYQFDPNEHGNAFSAGISGQGVINNRYNIPAVINGVDLTYGGPDQSITAGYYPNKSQFMGNPVGAGGVSLMYRKSFD